ncbi:hypothetical protein [Tenacibaculum agarivorans]|uniref:hypothetical protein n=1 Tax=Tenacibaculum agarivorans TaxID=1908389 RepID=UPI00094BAABF|nr:hypothetical protein [Tenacibaculum agarivorans]
MKSFNLFLLSLIVALASCSEEDNVIQDPDTGNDNPQPTTVDVVFNEVKYQGDKNLIEIYNRGNATADLSEYWLCLGPGAYQKIGDLTPESGTIALPSKGYLVVSYDLPADNGGLGLYSTNEFTNSEAIVDFVQYGAAGSARENVAAAAGIWTAGQFVPVVKNEDNSIIYDGTGNGADNWAETAKMTFGDVNVLETPQEPVKSVVINEVNYADSKQIELWNNGDVTVDLSEYWLCLGPGKYVQIKNATVVSGSTTLNAGDFLVVNWNDLSDSAGLGLYATNAFTSADAIRDFVQWGAAGSARENVAAAAGIWTAGEFVAKVQNDSHNIIYDGTGDAAADWSETTKATFGEKNILEAPVKSVVINEVNYSQSKQIELWNNGDIAVDVADYWLCLGPGMYLQLKNATVVSGNTSLEPGDFLVVNWNDLSNSAGLGLYATNAFTSSDAIRDFVQWGAAGSARENVAVAAGIWTAGDFMPEVASASSSILYDGEGDTSGDWKEGSETFGSGNAK